MKHRIDHPFRRSGDWFAHEQPAGRISRQKFAVKRKPIKRERKMPAVRGGRAAASPALKENRRRRRRPPVVRWECHDGFPKTADRRSSFRRRPDRRSQRMRWRILPDGIGSQRLCGPKDRNGSRSMTNDGQRCAGRNCRSAAGSEKTP